MVSYGLSPILYIFIRINYLHYFSPSRLLLIQPIMRFWNSYLSKLITYHTTHTHICICTHTQLPFSSHLYATLHSSFSCLVSSRLPYRLWCTSQLQLQQRSPLIFAFFSSVFFHLILLPIFRLWHHCAFYFLHILVTNVRTAVHTVLLPQYSPTKKG